MKCKCQQNPCQVKWLEEECIIEEIMHHHRIKSTLGGFIEANQNKRKKDGVTPRIHKPRNAMDKKDKAIKKCEKVVNKSNQKQVITQQEGQCQFKTSIFICFQDLKVFLDIQLINKPHSAEIMNTLRAGDVQYEVQDLLIPHTIFWKYVSAEQVFVYYHLKHLYV